MLFQELEQVDIEPIQAREILQQNAEWMEILLSSNEALSKSLELNEILQTLTDSAVKIIPGGSAAVYLKEDDLIYLGATTPALPPGFPENLRRARLVDHPHINRAISHTCPLILPDTHKADLTPAEREVSVKRGLRTVVYFPLKGNKRVHGAYIVASTGTPVEVSKIQMTLCHTLGTQASIAIENARLYRSVQKELEERKLIERELRASEEKYRLLVENQTDLVIKVDIEGRFLFVSQSYCRVFGKKEEELLGHKVIPLVHEEDRAVMNSAMKALFSPPHTAEVELRALTKEGWKWIAWSNSAIIDIHGTVREIISVGRDITERKRAENENAVLQSQLIQALKMESIGRLAGGVAHDFNNMLNVIMGNAELALDDLSSDNPLRVNLEEIRASAERSANLTRQLLAFARKQAISPKVLSLNECVASMLKMIGRLIGEDIELSWEPGKGLELIRIDPGQIDQLLANLVVNARDAIGNEVGKVTIKTANTRFDKAYCALNPAFMEGDYVELAIRDDGCGMDQETLANIFEPFYTTKGVEEGTGLGLATVYGIVKQNNGFINVYSKPGEGAAFHIYLPAHKTAKPEVVMKDRAVTPSVGGHETIIVVEDEVAILKIIQTILERLGYLVFAFVTPEEAIRLAESYTGRVDLLITDVVMPGMNGRDLANKLAALYPDIRSLFMSGYTADVIIHKGVLDKGVHFIQKPFSAKEMTDRVRKVLDLTNKEIA